MDLTQMTKIPLESDTPVTEKTQQEDAASSKPNTDISDAIRKIKDSVVHLPKLWLDGSASIPSMLSMLFDVPYRKYRFKTLGYRAFFETLISDDAAEYIYAIDSALSMLAPNTILQKASAVCRNVALLDSMVNLFTEKVDMTNELSDSTDVVNILKNCKDCKIKAKDYKCDSVPNIEMSELFMYEFAGKRVGDEVVLTSPRFRCGINDTETVHCKLIYQNAPLEMDDFGLLTRTATISTYVMAIEVKEFKSILLIAPRAGTDRLDISIRRICSSCLTFYVLHHEDDMELTWVRGFPFSTIDVNTTCMTIFAPGNIYASARKNFELGRQTEVFDQRTVNIVTRMAESGKLHCSRSYALVGIPGTGKSFIMNKLVRDDVGSAIIIPYFPDEGITYDMQRCLSKVINSIPQEHLFILLDDFDKCIGGKGDKTNSNQVLIEFFATLHRLCPGGYDKQTGKPKRTFTLIATMNNPKLLNNAIIKRSERFDEVIEIGLPQPYIYGKRLNSLRSDDDKTNFESAKFRMVYWYMRHKVITLADLGNIYSIMRIHRPKPADNVRYTIKDLIYAVRYIGQNRSSASKEYEI